MALVGRQKNKAMERSRAQKLEHFYSLCSAGCTVIDVGVSSEKTKASSAHRNYFRKNFHYPDEHFIGLGLN